MKTISPELKEHISGDLATLATCWQIRRTDGVSFGFTSHDQPVEVDQFVYAPVNAFVPSAISNSNDFNVDNMEMTSVISSGSIEEADILEGKFDHAALDIFQVNWADPSQGKLHIRSGWLGELSVQNGQFTAEVRGLSQKLQQMIGEVYSPECRANLGSKNCHVNLAQFTVIGAVTSVSDAATFTDTERTENMDWFRYGVLTWLSGANTGRKVEIRLYDGGTFTLFDQMPQLIQPGDRYRVHAGCDKRSTTCKNKFSNFLNFRAEPHVPGTDSLYNYPGLR